MSISQCPLYPLQLVGDEHPLLLLWVCESGGAANGAGTRQDKDGRHLCLRKHHALHPLGQRKDTAGRGMGEAWSIVVHTTASRQMLIESDAPHPTHPSLVPRYTPTPQTVCSRRWHTCGSCSSSSITTVSSQHWRTCLICCRKHGSTYRTPASQCCEASTCWTVLWMSVNKYYMLWTGTQKAAIGTFENTNGKLLFAISLQAASSGRSPCFFTNLKTYNHFCSPKNLRKIPFTSTEITNHNQQKKTIIDQFAKNGNSMSFLPCHEMIVESHMRPPGFFFFLPSANPIIWNHSVLQVYIAWITRNLYVLILNYRRKLLDE